jgi:hypothetical protein
MLGSLAAGRGAAHAGALSQVVKAIENKTGNDDKGDAAPKDPAGGAPREDEDDDFLYDDDDWSDTSTDGSYAVVPVAQPWEPPGPQPRVDLYLGVQDVRDSDGSVSLALRASHEWFGIGFAGTSYFEEVPHGPDGPESIRLDVWGLSGALRIVGGGAEPTELWLSGGLAGASSSEFQIFGGVVGAELDHRLGGELGIGASARLYAWQDDVRATELGVAARASVLRIGYRVLAFNVGPPLKGPELGIAVRF